MAEGGGGERRCGRIAVVGRANTGKSTLVNALLGRHQQIVAARPQTTRDVVACSLTLDEDQLVLVDTPGLHRRRQRANRLMNRAALQATEGADLLIAVFDRTLVRQDDQYLLEHCRAFANPCLAVLNKVDLLTDKNRLLPRIRDLADSGAFLHVIPTSATRGHNLDRLLELLRQLLPEAPHRMPADTAADKPDSFFVLESIREAFLHLYRQEIPHSLQLELEQFELRPEGLDVRALVRVPRKGQKAILLGAGGRRLQRCLQQARKALEERFAVPAELNLEVRVGRPHPAEPA